MQKPTSIDVIDDFPIQTPQGRREMLAQLASPLRAFLATEAGSAGLLLGMTVFALLWANSPWSDQYKSLWGTVLSIQLGDRVLSMDLAHWMNDGLMAVFFFVAGLEVRREVSIGQLKERRDLVVPVLAAFGGLIVPALVYLAINSGGDAAHGWGIVIGTDTAFLIGALALVGPNMGTQLRVFLLTVTVIDDVFAVSVIGVIYSEHLDVKMLGLALLILCAIALLSRAGVWRTFIYGIAGVLLWLATYNSGLHPTIAGMAAGLVIGAEPARSEYIERAATLFRAFRQSPLPLAGYSARLGLERAVSVNERLQLRLHPIASYVIVPLFALANAGVDLGGGVFSNSMSSMITWGIVVALVGGKLLGVGVSSIVAARFGAAIPRGIGPGQLLGGGALSGIGFTVSLLIIHLAFKSPELQAEATVGVLIAAALSIVVGWAIFHLAAVLHGETSASLPVTLEQPVDPGRDHIRGPVNAPMTLVEYGDYECPFCSAATGAVRELRTRFGDDLRYVFRHLPLPDVHPHAELAAQAAEAAGAQGRFWEMHDLLFEHQDQLEFEDLVGYATGLGLDVEAFARALREGRYASRVETDVASAEESGARGTPTFFIGEHRHSGPYDAVSLGGQLLASRGA
jgi:Na+/H+ antiporter NhaA